MPERPEVIKMRENAHDRQYVLENVSKEGGLLDYAGEEMKDDREIALAAIHNNPEALEYVSDRLKADREIVYDSVSEVGWTYCYAKENLLNDKELLHTKIIRDADKLDIFKVLNIENMNVLYGDDVEKQSINNEVYREFFEDKYINYKNINSGLDLAIAHFAYVYDFNYKFTLSKIKEDKVLCNLYNRFNKINNESKEKLNKVYVHAKNYLNKELEEAI